MCEPPEKKLTPEEKILHLTPAVTTVEQTTSTKAGLLGLSWPCLDDAELLRQLFKWFGGVPFEGWWMALGPD